jgi:hypothetical protein
MRESSRFNSRRAASISRRRGFSTPARLQNSGRGVAAGERKQCPDKMLAPSIASSACANLVKICEKIEPRPKSLAPLVSIVSGLVS